MRFRAALLFSLLFLVPPALAQPPTQDAGPERLTEPQIRDLIRQAAENDLANDKKARDYTYIQREEEHKLDGKGQNKSTESRTYEIMVLYEEPVRKQVAKDDKPLSEKDARKEEGKIQKLIDKRKNESDSDRRKRLEKEEKDREESRLFVQEIADAYNFTHRGTETLGGRETYVIDAAPRPGYEPKLKQARILPKFRFRVWVDKAEKQWVKLDAECIDTISFGWVLARLHKGSRLLIEQTRVNDEVWLPKYVELKIDARVALLKQVSLEENVTFRDYQKFRSATKITPLGQVREDAP
jgi:hypothetical protein